MANGQIKEPVHLSYNFVRECYDLKKVNDENGIIHFYIQNQHFKSISKDSTFKESNIETLKNNEVLNIYEFLKLVNEERERLIGKGEKDKTVKILFNDHVFDKIYLYVKDENNLIIRYLVKWVEEIE